jgi:hypothetical protein
LFELRFSFAFWDILEKLAESKITISICRSTLAVLGLATETHVQQHLPTSLHHSETSTSVSGATLT